MKHLLESRKPVDKMTQRLGVDGEGFVESVGERDREVQQDFRVIRNHGKDRRQDRPPHTLDPGRSQTIERPRITEASDCDNVVVIGNRLGQEPRDTTGRPGDQDTTHAVNSSLMRHRRDAAATSIALSRGEATFSLAK